MLRVDHLCLAHVPQLRPLSFELGAGQLLTVVGPSGSGKTSLVKVLCGFQAPRAGHVHLGDQNLLGLTPDQLIGRYLAVVPAGRTIFPRLSGLDNLLMGGMSLRRHERMRRLSEVLQLIPKLLAWQDQIADTLSGGEGQWLAVGRALMSHARVVILDDVSVGLSRLARDEFLALLKQLKQQSYAILMTESDAAWLAEVEDQRLLLTTSSETASLKRM